MHLSPWNNIRFAFHCLKSNNSDEKCSQPWEDDRDRVVWLIDLVNESVVIPRKSLVTEGKEIVQYNAVGEQLSKETDDW